MFQQAFCWNKAFEGGHCAKVCRESFFLPLQHCPSTPECPEILPIKSRIAEGSSSLGIVFPTVIDTPFIFEPTASPHLSSRMAACAPCLYVHGNSPRTIHSDEESGHLQEELEEDQ